MDDLSNRINSHKFSMIGGPIEKFREWGARIVGNCSVISHAMYDVKSKTYGVRCAAGR